MAENQQIFLKSGYILHCVLYYMYLEKTRSQSEVVHTTIFCCRSRLALQRECNFLSLFRWCCYHYWLLLLLLGLKLNQHFK